MPRERLPEPPTALREGDIITFRPGCIFDQLGARRGTVILPRVSWRDALARQARNFGISFEDYLARFEAGLTPEQRDYPGRLDQHCVFVLIEPAGQIPIFEEAPIAFCDVGSVSRPGPVSRN